MTAAIIFLLTYISIALGRIPGLVIDRAGIALLGAISMVVFHIVTVEQAIHAIDFSTILLLFGLMIISAQLRLGGFYSWSAARIMFLLGRPRIFLLYSMILSALLSAVLANDIVCFAFTPILALSVRQAGVNPLPFLLGLAISSNIGSAATIIGNPQNMLIGQVGHLDFESFLSWCSPPSLLALGISYTVLLWLFRGKLLAKEPPPVNKTIVGSMALFRFVAKQQGHFRYLYPCHPFFYSCSPRNSSNRGCRGPVVQQKDAHKRHSCSYRLASYYFILRTVYRHPGHFSARIPRCPGGPHD